MSGAKATPGPTDGPELSREDHRRLYAFTAGWRGERIEAEGLIVGLNTGGSGIPIFWCLQGFRELSQLATHLGPEQPIYGMRSGHLVLDYDQRDVVALGRHYAAEIVRTLGAAPCILGGNCQGCLITFEVARRLEARGTRIPRVFLLDPYRPEPYGGPVAVYYAHGSHNNPFRYYRWPEMGWRRLCPSGAAIEFVPGTYGVSFNEPHIQGLTDKIRGEIVAALAEGRSAAAHSGPPPESAALPAAALRAELNTPPPLALIAHETQAIDVTVRNASPTTWPAGEESGIALANRWLRGEEEVVQWVDARTLLPDALAPDGRTTMTLTVRAPETPGEYVLELDLVEEGVTWFVDRGSRTARCAVRVEARRGGAATIDDCERHREDGARLFDRGDFQSAISSYRRAVEIDPHQPFEVFRDLGEALVRERRGEEAVEAYEIALALRPRDADVHFRWARLLMELGHHEEAIDGFRLTLELHPESPLQVLVRLGGALEAVGDRVRALDAYAEALQHDPSDPRILSAMARCHHELGDEDRVQEICERALVCEPDNPHLYFLLGDAQRAGGDAAAAAASFERAVELGLEGAWPSIRLGDTLREQGDLDGAAVRYRQAIERDPQNPHAHFALASSLLQTGGIEPALPGFQRAVELDPRWALAHFGVGECHRRRGAHELALSWYRRAAALDPEHAPTRRAIASVQARRGRLPAALRSWVEARRLRRSQAG